MTVHWHDDECTWCPCDEVTTGDPERVAAWMRAIRLGPPPSSSVDGTTTSSEEQAHG
ncbi:hypothetical protein Cme02nite_38360 [Catellatospora methionotrophica]|uniref:Uncharacterized protein n=1 Tax=Catellatospora methionotrophica TaxID=121620 RepID=A0A8J3LH83_9ACTN|nr:hypothetical protein [Catellatospora methionotrophica]GIG15504.1 hypothetical protein Cme02nite_38360 [Catellatospora methionotrophica]